MDPNIQSPDIYQYNLTLERELPGDLGLRVSYIGSTMRKLLVDHDYNTLPANTDPFDSEDPEDLARLPFFPYGTFMDITENRGSGQLHAAQIELSRRWRKGFAINAAYTFAHSDSNAPDSGNSTIGTVMFDPYDIEKDRGPDPNVVKHRVVVNGTWDVISDDGELERVKPEDIKTTAHFTIEGELDDISGSGQTATGGTAPTCRAGPTRCSAGGRCPRSSRRAAGST